MTKIGTSSYLGASPDKVHPSTEIRDFMFGAWRFREGPTTSIAKNDSFEPFARNDILLKLGVISMASSNSRSADFDVSYQVKPERGGSLRSGREA